jgi:hypothetical protein
MQDIVEIEVHAGDLPDGRLGLLMLRNGSERFIALDMSETSREEILHREISKIHTSGGSGGTATIFRVLPEDVSPLKTADIGAIIRPLGETRRAWLADLFLDWSTREIAAQASPKKVPPHAPTPIVPVSASSEGVVAAPPAARRDTDPTPIHPERDADLREASFDAEPADHGGADPIEKLRDSLHGVAEEMRSAIEAAQRLSVAQDGRSSTLETSLEILSRTLAEFSQAGARLDDIEASVADLSRNVESFTRPSGTSLWRRIFASFGKTIVLLIYGLTAAGIGALAGWKYGAGIDPFQLFAPGSDARPLYEWRDVPRHFDL